MKWRGLATYVCVCVENVNPFHHQMFMNSFLTLNILALPSLLVLGDSSNSMTIIIISVTITTAIAKNYYHDSGHGCTFNIVSPRHIHNCTKKYVKMAIKMFLIRLILTKKLEVFSVGGLKEWL